MTPPRSSFQAAVASSSKGELIVCHWRHGATNPPLPQPDVLIENVGEAQSSPTASTEAEGNEHGAQLSPEGQLLQMLTDLQKQLDKQWTEVAHEMSGQPVSARRPHWRGTRLTASRIVSSPNSRSCEGLSYLMIVRLEGLGIISHHLAPTTPPTLRPIRDAISPIALATMNTSSLLSHTRP